MGILIYLGSYHENKILHGLDGNLWIVKKKKNNVFFILWLFAIR